MSLDFTEINSVVEHTNLATMLDEEILNEIGDEVTHMFEEDVNSRAGWTENNEKWMKLASQLLEEKNYPWPNASNVKYPLLTTASMQFHARAHQSLLKGSNPVYVRPLGKDEDGAKRSRAERLSDFMSWQLMHDMETWEEDMDRLLLVLPVVGLCFKKIYYSTIKNKPVSELVLPKDLVINYNATDFLRARKTHVLYKDQNEVIELQRKGVYLDVPLDDPAMNLDSRHTEDKIQGMTPSTTELPPHTVLESHTWYDLNDDGHKEPYIITVDRDSKTVLRITARFEADGVELGEKDKVLAIQPTEYFVRYVFLPDLNSSIYGLGFGSILGPLNSATNTITNQLVDSGHLATLPVGFLGRGIRLSRGGTQRFKPGEWKVAGSTGEDLKKGIFPLPVKEPSSTLFQLLGLLIQSGEKVGSIADIMLGENPGQNQPYSTTSAVLEQGLKVFMGIYKRVYRSLTKEYQQLFHLDHKFLDQETYDNIMDEGQLDVKADFDIKQYDVIPAADPNIVTQAQELMKAEALMQKVAAGFPVNPTVATKRILMVEGHEDIDELMEMPPPQPDLEMQFEMKKHEDQQQLSMAQLKLEAEVKQHEALKDQAQAILNFQKAQTEASKGDSEQYKAQAQQLTLFIEQMKAATAQEQNRHERWKVNMAQQGAELDMMGKQADLQGKQADAAMKQMEGPERQADRDQEMSIEQMNMLKELEIEDQRNKSNEKMSREKPAPTNNGGE